MQEALLAAATQWPRDGVPDNPRGWLITVASRRLTDLLRSEQARRRREDTVARRTLPEQWLRPGGRPTAADADDTLILLFLCCHPALSPASQIALTLRAVGGLTTAEIARAFLVPEATMTRRISRAKQRIKDSGAAVRAAAPAERARPARAVLHVLYLIFNEGYTAHRRARTAARRTGRRGDPADPDGAPAAARRRRGHRAARADAAHRRPRAGPHRRRTASWSRWPSRTAAGGRPTQIAEGVALITEALPRGRRRAVPAPGGDRGGARRGAERGGRPTGRRSSRCTRCCCGCRDNPVVALNHAVAVAMVRGAGGRARAARRPRRRPAHRRRPPTARSARPPAGDGG